MSIEVGVNTEYREYKEKIMFGLSGRQLLCTVATIVISISTFFLLTKLLKLTIDIASWVIIFEAIPLMALGFIKKDGMPFEQYFSLMIRQQLGTNKLPYQSRASDYHISIASEKENKEDENKEKSKRKTNNEAIIFTTTKKKSKKNRKAATKTIKRAKKEYRKAKRSYKKANKAKRRT